ncbi:MAG: hypothetical protein D6714_12820 [Bacteroidetes bacterium]|nr:MAG: hypothetical protein D6714_12820 [Bacteroidota bacterium]
MVFYKDAIPPGFFIRPRPAPAKAGKTGTVAGAQNKRNHSFFLKKNKSPWLFQVVKAAYLFDNQVFMKKRNPEFLISKNSGQGTLLRCDTGH